MLTRPSNRVLEAFSKLELDERFVEIKGWIEQSLDESLVRMMNANNDPELRQLQGSTKTLKEFIDVATKARSMLKK